MSYLTVDEMRVASPCEVPWSSMKGSATVRHCGECNKNVYNLSLMTRAEANELIIAKEGMLCVRLYQRFDGTVLTADCPKGLRALRGHYLRARVKVVAAVVAIVGFLGFGMQSCVSPVQGVPPVSVQDTTHHG